MIATDYLARPAAATKQKQTAEKQRSLNPQCNGDPEMLVDADHADYADKRGKAATK